MRKLCLHAAPSGLWRGDYSPTRVFKSLGTSLAVLACTIMLEKVPCMLALCSMLARPYYAPHYASIIRPSLGSIAYIALSVPLICPRKANAHVAAVAVAVTPLTTRPLIDTDEGEGGGGSIASVRGQQQEQEIQKKNRTQPGIEPRTF